jgi:hypothetical protein
MEALRVERWEVINNSNESDAAYGMEQVYKRFFCFGQLETV